MNFHFEIKKFKHHPFRPTKKPFWLFYKMTGKKHSGLIFSAQKWQKIFKMSVFASAKSENEIRCYMCAVEAAECRRA